MHRDALEADETFDRDEIDAWERGLREIDEAGWFCSCGIHFCNVTRKPTGE